MSGRMLNPGEHSVHSMVDQRSVHNRTLRAQITDVSNENGYVKINLDSSPAGGKFATVPMLWASFPQVGGAAWGRYMPHPSDIVKVAFDYDDAPRIVGYDVIATKDGVAEGRHGWPRLHSLYESARKDPSAKLKSTINDKEVEFSIAKYARFQTLNPGEYDFMSSGGSYIYGNNVGKLYMAGGSVSISLIKNDLMMENRSQAMIHYADDCIFRYGQMRRPDPTDQLIKPSSTTDKEFSIHLKTTTAPGTSVNLANLQLGNVVIDSGLAKEMLNGSDVRFLLRTYGANPLQPAYESAVDANGNWQVTGGATASTGIKFDYPTGKMVINAGSGFEVNAASHKFQGPMGTPPATQPLVMGTIYRAAEDILIGQLVAHITALNVTLATLGAALTAAGGVGTPPIAGAIAMAAALAAAGAAVTAAASASASLAPSAMGTFSATASTYLSQISKTG